MKSVPGRVLMGIGVTAALAATAACGGQDTGGSGSDPKKPAAKATPAVQEELKPLTEASGGSIMWLADTNDPDIRSVRPGRAAGGSDWIGLRRNEGYTVAGINQLPLLPGILVAMAFLLAIGSAWWREGR